jgi:DNA-directed RNA polymerase subunit RPC12/RpoP
MGIKVACSCGAQFMAKDELAGQSVKCPKCGGALRIPRATSPSTPATFAVACPCGRTYQVQPSMAGRPVKCNACGQQFVIPQAPAAIRTSPAPAFIPTSQPLQGAGPLDNLGDMSSFGSPTLGTSAAPNVVLPQTAYGMPGPTARPKTKKRAISKSALVSIGIGSIVLFAIVGIAIATFMFFPFSARYSTPEAVWDAQKKATASKDWKTLYNTFTPESQEQLVGGVALIAQLLATRDEGMTALMKKHGVESATSALNPSSPGGFAQVLGQMQEQMKKASNSIKNKQAFFVDVMEYFADKGEEFQNQMGGQKAAMIPESLALKDVVIEGDAARGTQTINLMGRSMEMPVAFRKIDGSWLIHNAAPSPG